MPRCRSNNLSPRSMWHGVLPINFISPKALILVLRGPLIIGIASTIKLRRTSQVFLARQLNFYVLHGGFASVEVILPGLFRAIVSAMARLFSTRLANFQRRIADEAQRLNSVKTLTHKSISLLNAPRRTLITATPMMNKGADLLGSLTLLHPAPDLHEILLGEHDKVHTLVGSELTPEVVRDYA